jgi:ATP-binding cassette, subfamily B (MDR/TAP), member 1
LLAAASGVMTNLMQAMAADSNTAYAGAGAVADETISHVRTVQAFGAESRAAEAYRLRLEDAMRIGIRSAITNGVTFGVTMAILFGVWRITRVLARSGLCIAR